jgi:hypothetical protein
MYLRPSSQLLEESAMKVGHIWRADIEERINGLHEEPELFFVRPESLRIADREPADLGSIW